MPFTKDSLPQEVEVLWVGKRPEEEASGVFWAKNLSGARAILLEQRKIGVVALGFQGMRKIELKNMISKMRPGVIFVSVSGEDPSEVSQLIRHAKKKIEDLRKNWEEKKKAFEGKVLQRFILTNDLGRSFSLACRLANKGLKVSAFQESEHRLVVVALHEIFLNAIEHGNLELGYKTKRKLKLLGEKSYKKELLNRMSKKPYSERKVLVRASFSFGKMVVGVKDEGKGFDFEEHLGDEGKEDLLGPSGRGILLAKNFMDGLIFARQGRLVFLLKENKKKIAEKKRKDILFRKGEFFSVQGIR